MASKSKRSKGTVAAAKARDAHTKGIYLRGGTYWLNFQRQGKRRFISLETAEFATACQRAHRLRYGPELAAKQGMEADIEAFFAAKKRLNVCSRQTERVHRAALMEFVKCHTFGIAVRDIRPSASRRTTSGCRRGWRRRRRRSTCGRCAASSRGVWRRTVARRIP